MIQVVEVNDVDQLAGYRLVWNSLLIQTSTATLFHSLDWVETYFRHFGRDQRLRVLFVYRGNEPLGILPLTVIREKTRIGRVRVLTYPLNDWGSFYGPIGPNPTATLIAGLAHVSGTDRNWEVLDLRWTDTEGSDRGRTEGAMRAAGFHTYRRIWKQVARIDTSGTWANYLSERDARFRSNLRDHIRRGERSGMTYIRYRPRGSAYNDADPRWDLYDACVNLARPSWQGDSSGRTAQCCESMRDYFRKTHDLASRTGTLDLNLMLFRGRPVAFAYNYHWRGHITGIRFGFDSEQFLWDIGTHLRAAIIRDSFARQDHTIDLGPSYMDSKRQWLTHVASSYRYSHYRRFVAKAQFLWAKRFAGESVELAL